MRLAVLRQPFDSSEWLFELKYDGFRAIAEVRDGRCTLMSRRRNVYRSFRWLCADIPRVFPRDCILDGEIVSLYEQGRPQFHDLLRRRSRPVFVAFDILSLDGRELTQEPLVG